MGHSNNSHNAPEEPGAAASAEPTAAVSAVLDGRDNTSVSEPGMAPTAVRTPEQVVADYIDALIAAAPPLSERQRKVVIAALRAPR